MTNHTEQFTVRLTDDLDAIRGQTEPAEATVHTTHLRKGDVLPSGSRVVSAKTGTKWVTVTVVGAASTLTTEAKLPVGDEVTVVRQVPTAIADEAWHVMLAVRQAKVEVAAHEKAVAKIASGSSSDLAWYAEEVMGAEKLAGIWTEWLNHSRHNDVNRDAALAVLADFVDYQANRVLTWHVCNSTSNGHRMEDAAHLAATQQFVKDASYLVR